MASTVCNSWFTDKESSTGLFMPIRQAFIWNFASYHYFTAYIYHIVFIPLRSNSLATASTPNPLAIALQSSIIRGSFSLSGCSVNLFLISYHWRKLSTISESTPVDFWIRIPMHLPKVRRWYQRLHGFHRIFSLRDGIHVRKTVNFRLFIVVYAGDYGIRIERREGVVHFLQFSFYFFFQIIFGLVGDFVYCTEYKAFIVRKGACFLE